MTITLDLSPQEEQQLHQLAAQQEINVRKLVLQAMKRLLERPQSTSAEIAAANAELFTHTTSLGCATGLDNEQIDADLSREYGDDHANLYTQRLAHNAA